MALRIVCVAGLQIETQIFPSLDVLEDSVAKLKEAIEVLGGGAGVVVAGDARAVQGKDILDVELGHDEIFLQRVAAKHIYEPLAEDVNLENGRKGFPAGLVRADGTELAGAGYIKKAPRMQVNHGDASPHDVLDVQAVVASGLDADVREARRADLFEVADVLKWCVFAVVENHDVLGLKGENRQNIIYLLLVVENHQALHANLSSFGRLRLLLSLLVHQEQINGAKVAVARQIRGLLIEAFKFTLA